MITIPTGEFVGILSDAIPFACTDDDLPSMNCVLVEWDGDVMHAISTDSIRMAWSQWAEDDELPSGEVVQEDLLSPWGADDGDEPWSILLPLADAKHLVKTYKLPVKEVWTPLQVDVDRGAVPMRLVVERRRETGHSAIRTVVEGSTADFPKIRDVLTKFDRLEPVTDLAYTATRLADFAKVRPRGPMELKFTGRKTPTHVTIGTRFIGAIQPARIGKDPA